MRRKHWTAEEKLEAIQYIALLTQLPKPVENLE